MSNTFERVLKTLKLSQICTKSTSESLAKNKKPAPEISEHQWWCCRRKCCVCVYPEVDAHSRDEAPGEKGSIFEVHQKTGLPDAWVPHQHHLRHKWTEGERRKTTNAQRKQTHTQTPQTLIYRGNRALHTHTIGSDRTERSYRDTESVLPSDITELRTVHISKMQGYI